MLISAVDVDVVAVVVVVAQESAMACYSSGPKYIRALQHSSGVSRYQQQPHQLISHLTS